ncbi:uridylate-specific endoribonuclease [Spea bombifrons]|uniref:uridylate-specific endoribonuclease n=1 Tax=Spea bombifrons TaxID=233779 RepID=UPI00234B4F7A|nr:uridylate-specific endoribonuclease [Spea bombifrons]
MRSPLVFLLFLVIGGIFAFETCPSDSCEDSCKNRCGHKPDKSYSCQCNEHCERFHDCCKDYHLCLYVDPSLNEVTHPFDESDNDNDNDNDSNEVIRPADKKENTCQGRCGEKFNKKDSCHCNKKCDKFNNCCSDYNKLCGGGKSDTVSDSDSSGSGHEKNKGTDISNQEIKEISELMYKLDVNKAAKSDIILNKQSMAEHTRNQDDLSEQPLYQYVNEDIFQRPTYSKFIKLTNNYIRKTGTAETYTAEELKEHQDFLEEIMKTKLMKELYNFFHKKGLYKTEKEFVDDLEKMWFGLYCRSSGEADSSGFEHVFMGEVKKGKVSGFHSWIRFYLLEKEGIMDYYSYNYDGPWSDYPDLLGQQFHWDGFYKEVGSQFIGSSPEFDLGLYTLCFISRPGKKCKISLGGHELGIQTYEWTKTTYGNGKKYIGTAYPVV